MLDIKFIRENVELVKKNSVDRKAVVDIDKLLELDKQRRETETKIEELRAKRNVSSKTKPSEAEIAEMKKVGNEIQKLEKELTPIVEKYQEFLLAVPNLTHPDVKISQNEEENTVLLEGTPTKFDFEPKDHVELAEKLDLIDFERGTKVAGAKFYYLKNEVALLQLALTQYTFEIAVKRGYIPIITPDLAKREILDNMGYNPRGESTQIYNIEKSDLSLIGTAEITMGGYHKGEILKEEELPLKYVAMSHCFRTEAGAYSKHSKGIFRVHQFAKVELFQYVLSQKAEKAHLEMLELEKEIFDGFKIPYRVIDHCTADLGAPSYRTYDLEAWMPGKPGLKDELGNWGEITSVSNCTDYQSRGLNIKYQKKDGGREFAYMINGTAMVMTRPIIAILENCQQKDGSIKVPDVLHKYLGFEVIKR